MGSRRIGSSRSSSTARRAWAAGDPVSKNKQTKICKAHFLEARRNKCPLKVNKTCISRGWGFRQGPVRLACTWLIADDLEGGGCSISDYKISLTPQVILTVTLVSKVIDFQDFVYNFQLLKSAHWAAVGKCNHTEDRILPSSS